MSAHLRKAVVDLSRNSSGYGTAEAPSVNPSEPFVFQALRSSALASPAMSPVGAVFTLCPRSVL